MWCCGYKIKPMALVIRAYDCAKLFQSCSTLCNPVDYTAYQDPLSMARSSPGKNTGVGCHALLQGMFPTQGLNLHLLHCRWILRCLVLNCTVLYRVGFPSGSVVKNPPANSGDAGSIPSSVPVRRKWQPTPVFLPGKSHG